MYSVIVVLSILCFICFCLYLVFVGVVRIVLDFVGFRNMYWIVYYGLVGCIGLMVVFLLRIGLVLVPCFWIGSLFR